MNSLVTKEPPKFRHESRNILHLCLEFIWFSCAPSSVSQLYSSETFFNHFVVSVRECLQLSEDSSQISAIDSNYQRYGRIIPKNQHRRPPWHHRTRVKVVNGTTYPGPPPLHLSATSTIKCFVCGKIGHYRRECHSVTSMRDSVKSRLTNGTSNVQLIEYLVNHLYREDQIYNSSYLTEDASDFDSLCDTDEE